MKKLLFFAAFVYCCSICYSQTPKEARDLNLKTKTTWVTEKKGKKEISYKKLELRFDKDGSLIQEVEFNTKGDVIRNISYQYQDKKKTGEIFFDKEGKIIKRVEYVLNKKAVSEIRVYDADNVLIRKEQFIYEQQD